MYYRAIYQFCCNRSPEHQLITTAPPHSCHLFPLYSVPALTIFVAQAWIRVEHSNPYFGPVNRESANGFYGNVSLPICWPESQHRTEVPQVNWLCFITYFPLSSLWHLSSQILTDGLCETFLACPYVKVSLISSCPIFLVLYLSVVGTKFPYFSLLFMSPQVVLILSASLIFLPVCQQLWVKAIASSSGFFAQRSMTKLVYKHLHKQYTPLAKLFCLLPLSAENHIHVATVSYFWKQFLDCYLQSTILSESKV